MSPLNERPPATPLTDELAAHDFVPDWVWIKHARQLERECLEQARLNGMGSEREAALLGRVERLERENAKLRDMLRTYNVTAPNAWADQINLEKAGLISYDAHVEWVGPESEVKSRYPEWI